MSENNPTPPSDTEEPTEPENPEPTWTIIVYLAGDNNLADECVFSLTEMKAANPDPRINVVAQFDPTGRRKKTQRFALNSALAKNNGQPTTMAGEPTMVAGRQDAGGSKGRGKIIDDVIDGLPEGEVKFPGAEGMVRHMAVETDEEGETDSGDPKVLFDFISWTVDNFPADRYMVVLSGHGSGANQQEFLRDDSSNGTLTIAELGEVFKVVKEKLKNKQGEPLEIDIVGMDSCLMSMAEVCFQLLGSVNFMISSESFGPRSGWPYGRILEGLTKLLDDGKGSAEDLASLVVKEHVDFYVDYAVTNGMSVDISLMDVRQAGALHTAVTALAAQLTLALKAGKLQKQGRGHSDFLDQLVLAHWEAQSYNGELYVDLFDFCSCLKDRYNPGLITPVASDDPTATQVNAEIDLRTKVGKVCSDVMDVIDGGLVKKSCYMGVTFQYSFGVSIYFPWAEVAPDYKKEELSFLTDSGWREFLDEYVELTRRDPRGFKQGGDVVITLDENIRKTPTDQKGPADVLIRSMRNPPIQVIKGGLSSCTPRDELPPIRPNNP